MKRIHKFAALVLVMLFTVGFNVGGNAEDKPTVGVMRDISVRELVDDIKVGFNFGPDTYYNMVEFWKNDEDYTYTSLPISVSVNAEGFSYQTSPKARLLRKGDEGSFSIRLPNTINASEVQNLWLDFGVPYSHDGKAPLTVQINELSIVTENNGAFGINGYTGIHTLQLEGGNVQDGYWVESPMGCTIVIELPENIQDAKMLEHSALQINLSILDAPMPDEVRWDYILSVPDNLFYFDEMKKSGYNAVRINASLEEYMSLDTGKISEDWFRQTEELVRHITDLEMYCLLTIHNDFAFYDLDGVWVGDHYDVDWLTDEFKPFVDKRWEDIWTQIAVRFKDYSDYLIFQSANEPGMSDINSKLEREDSIKISIQRLNELNQIFVNSVRATGGNNSVRVLNIASYGSTLNNGWDVEDIVLPNDDRITLSVHCYPAPFDTKTWSSENPEDIAYAESVFDFIERFQKETGVPVLLDEWGTVRVMDLTNRIDLTEYFIGRAKALGVPCFYWEDNYAFGGFADELCGSLHFDMQNKKWKESEIIEAMMGAVYGSNDK